MYPHDDEARETGQPDAGNASHFGQRRSARPPAMGETRRIAEAQALTLRAELRVVMRLRNLTPADVARLATLDAGAIAAFLDGASLNPRWQERLARWLERADAEA